MENHALYPIQSIYFKGYKCFSDTDWSKLENINLMNVIIGCNNSGKSSVLDVLECMMEEGMWELYRPMWRGVAGDTIPIKVHRFFSKEYIEKHQAAISHDIYRNTFDVWKSGLILTDFVNRMRDLRPQIPDNNHRLDLKQLEKELRATTPHSFERYRVRRIAAERDIVPESTGSSVNTSPQNQGINVSSQGVGANILIHEFLNDSTKDATLIEKTLLENLNQIIYPDAYFTRIRSEYSERENERLWEVYLDEQNGKSFPLSRSGSGLKTIILILLNLLVIPKTERYCKKKIVYAFEEPENNLHPALQRRLFDYLYQFSTRNGVCIFLTTHSHIAVDLLANKSDASLFHVQKSDVFSYVEPVKKHQQMECLLDDLGIKASDLLQTNGIIWVEGPSDRIYIKRWLEIFTENQYQEGVHYQILHYGGALLRHFSANIDETISSDSDDECDSYIQMLRTNRNIAIVMDSDKQSSRSKLKKRVQRIKGELQDREGSVWITEGREIENYLPAEAVAQVLGVDQVEQCGQYESFGEYYPKVKISAKKKRKTNDPNSVRSGYDKVELARKISPLLKPENSEGMLDLKRRIVDLYALIKRWNQDEGADCQDSHIN